MNRKRPYESLYNTFVDANKGRYQVDLTYEEFREFTKHDRCHYCDAKITWAEYNRNANGYRYNLDRKDNTLGYSKDNLVACCLRCNYGKGFSFSYEQWRQIGWFMQDNPDVFKG